MTKVMITGVDTLPRSDHAFKSPGNSTYTVLIVDLHNRRASVRQKTVGEPKTWREGWQHDVVIRIIGYPNEDDIRKALETGVGQELLVRACNGYRPVWDINDEHVLAMSTRDGARALNELELFLDEVGKGSQHYVLFDTKAMSGFSPKAVRDREQAEDVARAMESVIRSRNAVPNIPISAIVAREHGLFNISELESLISRG